MADEGLVQFLVLAKGAKGAACVALIQQVLSSKKLFVFGELLAMPNVQAVNKAAKNISCAYTWEYQYDKKNNARVQATYRMHNCFEAFCRKSSINRLDLLLCMLFLSITWLKLK